MATDICPICRENLPASNDGIARQCNTCGALINSSAQALDYTNGNGQSPPDQHKSHWRLVNARRRMAIIAPFLAGHTAFIDIGCGSGETLLAARESLPTALGYEINEPLVCFGRSTLGVDIEQSMFSADRLPGGLRHTKKILASSHVLEHLASPIELLHEIRQACNPEDLVYLEVPLHTGESFSRLGYQWSLWNDEHLLLFSLPSLVHLAERAGFTTKTSGTRIFARGSHSGSTRFRLLRQRPLDFIKALANKPAMLSVADVMVADYGFVVLGA